MTSGQPGTARAVPRRDLEPRPVSLENLIAALLRLPALGDVDRARSIPGLIEAAKTVLSRERGAAMAAATAPGGISRAELARRLGISRSKVTEAIGASTATPATSHDHPAGALPMTIEEAAALAKLPAAQARVMYKPGGCDEKGTVVAVDGSDVFVRFDGELASRAARPEDLAVIGQEGPGDER